MLWKLPMIARLICLISWRQLDAKYSASGRTSASATVGAGLSVLLRERSAASSTRTTSRTSPPYRDSSSCSTSADTSASSFCWKKGAARGRTPRSAYTPRIASNWLIRKMIWTRCSERVPAIRCSSAITSPRMYVSEWSSISAHDASRSCSSDALSSANRRVIWWGYFSPECARRDGGVAALTDATCRSSSALKRGQRIMFSESKSGESASRFAWGRASDMRRETRIMRIRPIAS
mmetsp:Transcript_68554/g.163578  ORF Transcript_68554/g.163578 Transcript_68554/m.163578 type:complete len:235 (-) Transcript_68554:257-961(-)